MSGRTTILLLAGMLAGIVLGFLLGTYAPGFMLAISFIGKLFIGALTILAAVLIVAGLVVGITRLGDYRKLGRSGSKSLLYFAVTGIIAVIIGIAAGYVFNPGGGYVIPGGAENLGAVDVIDQGYTLYNTVLPDNGLGGIAGGQFFGLIALSIAFGVALLLMGAKARPVVTFFSGVTSTLGKMAMVLLYAAPLGLLSLIGTSVAGNQPDLGQVFTVAGGFPFAVIIAALVYGVIILPLALKIFGKRPILSYLASLSPAVTAGFGTASSTSAIPYTYEGVVHRQNVDQRAGSLVLPLGTILNFGPTAMIVVLGGMFLGQAMGMPLGFGSVLLLALLAILLSLGLAGVPGVITPLLYMTLGLIGTSEGLVAGIVIVVATDWLVDRVRGAANTWGDAVGAAVIGETFEFKTATRAPAREPRRQPQAARKGRERRQPAGDRKPDRADRRRPDRRTGSRERTERPSWTERKSSDRRSGGQQDRGKPRQTGSGRRQESGKSPFQVTSSTPPALDVESEKPSEPVSRFEPRKSATHRTSSPAPSPRAKEPEQKPVQEKARLSREKAEEELARVSAQLRSRRETAPPEQKPERQEIAEETPKENHFRPETSVTPDEGPSEDATGVTPREEHVPAETERERVPSDAEITEEEEPAEEEIAESVADEEEAPAETETVEYLEESAEEETEEESEEEEEEPEDEEEPGIHYGRTKSRRKAPHPTETEEKNEQEAEGEDSFSTEGISFGRGKRKRTR